MHHRPLNSVFFYLGQYDSSNHKSRWNNLTTWKWCETRVTQILEDALLTHSCLSLPLHTEPVYLPFTSSNTHIMWVFCGCNICSVVPQGSVGQRKWVKRSTQSGINFDCIPFNLSAVAGHSSRTGVPLGIFQTFKGCAIFTHGPLVQAINYTVHTKGNS